MADVRCRDFGRYETRADARKAARTGGGEHRRAYYCNHCSYWHIGRLPEVIRRGEATSGDYYAPTGRSPGSTLRRRRLSAAALLERDCEEIADRWAAQLVGEQDPAGRAAARAELRHEVAELATMLRELAGKPQ